MSQVECGTLPNFDLICPEKYQHLEEFKELADEAPYGKLLPEVAPQTSKSANQFVDKSALKGKHTADMKAFMFNSFN